jgi:hypothetical protein
VQDFNSLHAQREACAAYVLSQASEGWNLIPDEYDDGGLSGGSLERPALKRLLADIGAGKMPVRLARSGMAVRLIHTGGNAPAATLPDPALVKLLVKARGWWAKLASGEMDITALAAAEGANDSYVSRVVRLAFLAPDIVDAILAGKQRASVNATAVIQKTLSISTGGCSGKCFWWTGDPPAPFCRLW